MSPISRVPRRGIVAWLVSLPRRLWHEAADLAERGSRVGHGPEAWQETSEIENPYAGSGPGRPPKSPFGEDEPRPKP